MAVFTNFEALDLIEKYSVGDPNINQLWRLIYLLDKLKITSSGDDD